MPPGRRELREQRAPERGVRDALAHEVAHAPEVQIGERGRRSVERVLPLAQRDGAVALAVLAIEVECVARHVAGEPEVRLHEEGLILVQPGESLLETAGARVESIEGSVESGFRRLATVGVQSVLLEGGARIQQAAWEAGMIDEVRLFVAPQVLGRSGVPFAGDRGLSIAALSGLKTVSVGPDVLITGYVHRPH